MPDAGSVRLAGRDDDTRSTGDARHGVRVPAVLCFIRTSRVYDNLAFPAALAGAARNPRNESARGSSEIARLLHIEDKLANRATQLSGGTDAARGDRPRIGAAPVQST